MCNNSGRRTKSRLRDRVRSTLVIYCPLANYPKMQQVKTAKIDYLQFLRVRDPDTAQLG